VPAVFQSIMIGNICFKVCGLRSVADADFADRTGADYLGFILYPKSPRFLSLQQYHAIAPALPVGKRVAVMVSPTAEELSGSVAAGFDYFQIHFPLETSLAKVADWSRMAGPERLWLAPKLPPEVDVAAEFLPLASFFLLDTFQVTGFGGSGKTGDWPKFARHQKAHPEKTWILSGGLNPENITEALGQSGARFVDVNSGVEAKPGVKDHAKLKALVAALAQVK